MRFIALFLFIASCSSEVPTRKLASTEVSMVYGEIDHKKSNVQLFHKGSENQGYYLYVQLKNEQGDFIDCEKEDFFLKGPEGKRIEFHFLRKLRGRFYLIVENGNGEDFKEVDLLVKGAPLRESFKLQLRRPHASQTKMILIQKLGGKIFLRLKLADKANRSVESSEIPEIFIEGTDGFIQDMKNVGDGIWDFTVVFSEESQLMYFSVRYMGVNFPNLYRYQHVDK
jgi:hypothetical protein